MLTRIMEIGISEDGNVKRRRTAKSSASVAASPSAASRSLVSITNTDDRSFQARTSAHPSLREGLDGQLMSRPLQRLMLPGTDDLDIQNSILCHSSCATLTPKTSFQARAKNRDEIIRYELKMSRKQGKKLLHQVLFGANWPTALSGNKFMQKFQKTSVYLKWLACSLLPKVYERLITIEKMSNPEASTLFYLYAAVEDYVLDAWDQDLMRRRPKHISLHFDCIRVGGLDQRFLHRCCVTRLLQRC